MFHTCEIFYKLTFERETQSHTVSIKVYHTYNRILNKYNFTYYLLKKHQKVKLSEDSTLHQNRTEENSIQTLVTITRTILMHAVLKFPRDTFSTDFRQWKRAMIYGSTFGYLIFSLVYQPLRNVKKQGLNHYLKH